MKKILPLLYAGLACTVTAFSQNLETVKFKGEDFRDFLLKEEYRYPAFKQGKMYYREGGAAKGLMNYSFLFGEMQFINSKGYTLAIADVNSIAYITVAKDTFYYQEGYFEKIPGTVGTSLLVKKSLKFVDEQKTGAFGVTATTGGVVSADRYSEFHEHRLGINSELIFAKHKAYYFKDARGNIVAASKKNLEKNFLSETRQMQKYVAENNIDINREEGLVKLLVFLNSFR